MNMCINKIIERFKKEDTTQKETIKLHNELAGDNQFMRLNRVNATLRANKLISLIFSHIDYKKDNKNENGFIYVNIPYNTINNYITTSGVAYHDDSFKEIAKDIINASIVSGRIKGSDVAFPIIDYVKNNDNDKSFTFRINDIFVPYVQQLQSQYSVLQLDTIKGFRSNHAFVLYQELMSWYDHDFNTSWKIKERYYTTSDLFKLFNLGKDDYHLKNGKLDRYNFEKKVLKKAVDDINAQEELRVLWEKKKSENGSILYWFTYASALDQHKILEREKEK